MVVSCCYYWCAVSIVQSRFLVVEVIMVMEVGGWFLTKTSLPYK